MDTAREGAVTTYKGDSPGKKVVRAKAWVALHNWAKILGLPEVGTLVLAGSGGDVICANGLGMDTSKFVAVDYSKDALKTTRERCSAVMPPSEMPSLLFGDVAKVSQMATYNSAHIDFCGGFTIENLRTLEAVVRNMETMPALLTVTMLKGRERFHGQRLAHDRFPLAAPRVERKRHARSLKRRNLPAAAKMMKHGKFDPKELLSISTDVLRDWTALDPELSERPATVRPFTSTGELTSVGGGLVRQLATQQALSAFLAATDLRLFPLNSFTYHSATKKQHGTPFCTFMFLVYPKQIWPHLGGHIQTDPRFAQLIQWYGFDKRLGWKALRHFALSLAEWYPLEDAAKVFDIPAARLRAWKAHDTMGTYDDEKEEASQRGWGFSKALPYRPVGGQFRKGVYRIDGLDDTVTFCGQGEEEEDAA